MITEQSTDFMYMNGNKGLKLHKFKGYLTMTVYEDIGNQVFYTEGGNYVYKKQEEKVYQLTHDGWTRMVLKMECYFNKSTISYAGDLKSNV